MTKPLRFAFFVVSLIVILIIFGNWATTAQANGADIATPTPTGTPVTKRDGQGEPVSAVQQEELKVVIQNYFEMRHQMLSVSQSYGFRSDGFGALVSDQPDTKAFLDAELGKLAVEIKYAESNHSRYVDYKYFLNFSNFSLDTATQLVTVAATEDNEIVYEISTENNPANPLVTHMSGLAHTIVLRNEQGRWKIVSDHYNDFLWRTMRQNGESVEAILNRLNTVETPKVVGVSNESLSAVPTLPPDPHSHSYNREDAVTYAKDHASKADYNLDYPSYDDKINGDCTNFVSQALYEGGNISLEIPNPLPPPRYDFVGEEGWYLFSNQQRGRYWNEVNAFYDFVTQSYGYWQEGPEGVVFPAVPYGQFPADLAVGDVIQYNDGYDATWDHAVIVVGKDPNNGHPIVASHSPNIPDADFMTVVPNQQMRFIHIERSDGYPPVKAKIEGNPFTGQSTDDAGTNPLSPYSCAFSLGYPEAYFGLCPNSSSVTSGFRFTNIQIPQLAQVKVKYAYLIFTVDGQFTAPLDVKIYGENITNSPPFSATNRPDQRGVTALVPWHITETWNLSERRTTPNLSTIVQSIVGNNGWQNGNALSFIFKDPGPYTGVRRVITYERAVSDPNLFPAKLIAAYDLVPIVQSVIRASANPSNATSVNFTVTFSESVTGVDVSNFALTKIDGNISGMSISAVNKVEYGENRLYTVTVNTGNGDGTLRLDIVDNNTIVDDTGNMLGGPALGDGNFTTGETYTIRKTIVSTFTVNPSSASLVIPITAFTASDPISVSGYIITESATAPDASASGWSGTAPTTYTVSGDGNYTLYPWTKDTAGSVSAIFSSPRTVTVDTPPTVLSSVRADANPTNRFSVSFTVTFSESVTGVDTGDFNLTKTGPIHGETVTSVTGGPIIYTVSVNTGTGNGTLRLNVVDNNTIVDATSNPLGGAAVGDGNFNGGQTYTVTHFALFLPLIEASLTASPSTNQGVLSDLPAYPGP